MIRAGLSWLRDMQDIHLTDPATITRGGVTVSAPAMVASQEKNNTDVRGLTTAYTQISLIIGVADYRAGTPAVAVTPAVGDVILCEGKTYTVNRTRGGDECWTYSDMSQLAYRVFVDLTGDT